MPIPEHGTPPTPTPAPGTPPAAPTTPGTPAPTAPVAPAHTTSKWGKIMGALENVASFLVWPLVVIIAILVYLFCKGSETALGILITIVVSTMMCVAFWFVAREKEASALVVPPPPADPSVEHITQAYTGEYLRWAAGASAWQYWDGTDYVDLT